MAFRLYSIFALLFALFVTLGLNAQTDTTGKRLHERISRIENELRSDSLLKRKYDDMTFYYSHILQNRMDSALQNQWKLSAYVESYYASYSDHLPLNSYQKFPTSAPIANTFGLNMAMVNLQYQNESVNGVLTLHAGDIASSAWSSHLNFVQEAHLGIRLIKKLWLEGGYFRTHLGFESIQPRENIGSTIALTTYYEPYYLSGAKLTYYVSNKLSLQLNAFNGFNTFVSINKKKTYGFSTAYEIKKNLILTYNCLLSDNTPDSIAISHWRWYNDMYLVYKSKRFNLGLETNLGFQQHTGLNDSTKTAMMFSMTAAAKYKMFNDRFSLYGRAEFFNDPDEILTGPVNNDHHQLVGIQAYGVNLGIEYKPMPNAYWRIEGRYLHLLDNETLFYTGSHYVNKRAEMVTALGFWF